jgi:uncharacterized lipoprotein YddW (UPF0748 family)
VAARVAEFALTGGAAEPHDGEQEKSGRDLASEPKGLPAVVLSPSLADPPPGPPPAGDPPLAQQTRAAILESSDVFDAETLRHALNLLADRNWNTVVIPGFLGSYPVFPSSVWADYGMRRQHPGFRKWNPLEVAFDVAWRRGLNLTVSIKPYVVEPGVGWRRSSPIERRHPDWLAARHPNRRKRLPQTTPGRGYYCPANPEYRRFLADTLYEVMETYPFHGVLIDLRFYPFYTLQDDGSVPWCYCKYCRERTTHDLGFDPAGVDFERERTMVERWREWQTHQMDEALAYIRLRVLKSRRTMRVLGLLTTESALRDREQRPLIHWKTWVERSLVEALVLDSFAPDAAGFAEQLRGDLETLSENSLLIPMLPRLTHEGNAILEVIQREPVPGFATRFPDWNQPGFDPDKRVRFEGPAHGADADPITSICALFDQICLTVPEEEELVAFLRDLRHVLTRSSAEVTVDRLTMVALNVRGLHDRMAEGRMALGSHQERVLHDLDLAARLTYLACCDLME